VFIVLISEPALAGGIALAVLSGLMNGIFTLPMRFLGRWSWENAWSLFILISCILMPLGIALSTVSRCEDVFRLAPTPAIVFAVVAGFAWGFGAIMFGQGVSAIGISMGNTLVLAISSSLGSFLPILILAPGRLLQPQGKSIMLGTVVGILGISACGYAGFLRERSQESQDAKHVRGDMVGLARPFWIGLLLCAGSGLLSAVFNIGYSSAQGIIATATRLGNSSFAGSNLVWLLMLTSGAVANLAFCGYLFKKNRSWAKFSQQKVSSLYALAILMGLLWGGSIFVYGAAAPRLGRLGPAIGWPLSLTTGLLTANLCGIVAGEWKLSQRAERAWMIAGLAILLVAIITLGWSSTLA
jgi:L-rhamnose-H+ transport protein